MYIYNERYAVNPINRAKTEEAADDGWQLNALSL
jgi:hypothetical protein